MTIFRGLRRACRSLKPLGRKAVARIYFSLPVFSRRDPRHNLFKFKDHCREVPAIPVGNRSDSQDWYLEIRAGETIRRNMSIGLNEAEESKFRAGTLRYQFGCVFNIPPVFLGCLHAAKIYSRDFLVLSSNDRILFESALSEPKILEANGILERISRPVPKPRPGQYCLLASPWSNSHYYHWLLDALPRLSIIECFAELNSTPLIVPGELKSFHRQSLEMASVSSERLVGFDGGCWQVDKLFFPELLSKTGSPSPHAVAWLRERFLGQIEKPPSLERKIYVTRRDAPQRRIVNEDQIVSYLQSQGFETVCPGDLCFAEQIRTFANAKIVIGPHGAGFANMVFASRNATLVEFFGDNYVNGCFWAITNILGQKHAFLTSPASSLDYHVPLDKLKALLDKVAATN